MKDTCKIDGCDKVAHARGWCGAHYQRWNATGDPNRYCLGCKSPLPLQLGSQKYCGMDCRPKCSVEGCDKPQRKREWCGKHHARWLSTGDPVKVKAWEWSTEWVCVVCGDPVEKDSGRRKHCSNNCQAIDSRNKGITPKASECLLCNSEVSFFDRHPNGRKRRSDTKLCDECGKVNARVWRRLIPDLIKRDGTDCGICGDDIDSDLKFPHPRSLTVDHVLPRSLGGLDSLDNLRLAHALCNSTRQNRLDYQPA